MLHFYCLLLAFDGRLHSEPVTQYSGQTRRWWLYDFLIFFFSATSCLRLIWEAAPIDTLSMGTMRVLYYVFLPFLTFMFHFATHWSLLWWTCLVHVKSKHIHTRAHTHSIKRSQYTHKEDLIMVVKFLLGWCIKTARCLIAVRISLDEIILFFSVATLKPERHKSEGG